MKTKRTPGVFRVSLLWLAAYSLVACSLGVITLGGCSVPANADGCSLTVTVGTAARATATANLEANVATLEIVLLQSGTTVSSTTLTVPFAATPEASFPSLSPGEYAVRVIAKNASAAQIGLGTASVSLVSGGNKSALVDVVYSQSGTGALDLAFSWPDSTGLNSWYAFLDPENPAALTVASKNVATMSATGVVPVNGTYSSRLQKTTLASGQHSVYLYFNDDADAWCGPIVASVNIWDNQTTDSVVTGTATLSTIWEIAASEIPSSDCAITLQDAIPTTTGTAGQFTLTGITNGFYLVQGADGQSITASLDGVAITCSGKTWISSSAASHVLSVTVTAPDCSKTASYAYIWSAWGLAYESNGIDVSVPTADTYSVDLGPAIVGTLPTSANGMTVRWTHTQDGTGTAYSVGDSIASPGAAGPFTLYASYSLGGTASALRSIANDLDATYVLTANVDLTGAFWPSPSNFAGKLYGNGHTISNLTAVQGLFQSTTATAIIQDVYLTNVNVTHSGDTAGGLVGDNYGSISGCMVSGTVTGTAAYVGGLVAGNGGIISRCYSMATVSGASVYVGGLVGYNGGTISDCFARGAVSSTSENCGGLVGSNVSYSVFGTIIRCYSTGSVTGVAGSNYGGLVGLNYYGTVYGSVTNGYYDQETSGSTLGTTSTHGTPLTSAEMKTLGPGGCNFTSAAPGVWESNAAYNGGYPSLVGLPR